MPHEEEFCLVDLWAAEAYLTSLDARATELLAMLDRGEKIHQWMLDVTQEKFPKLAKDYTYHKAKQTIHALNYGVEPNRMSIESGLPTNITSWQHTFYHGKFPGIKMRQLRIKQHISKYRYIVSLLGRKKYFFAPLCDELFKQAYAWPSQSCIGEITIAALNKIFWVGNASKANDEYPWMFPAMNTHDGLAIRCFKGNREKVTEVVKDAFDIPLTIDEETITIPVEVGWGENFNDMICPEVVRYV